MAGYLHGGMTAWREERRGVQGTARLTVPEVHERWAADRGAIQVLDVRERSEWEPGHLPGSAHRPYHDVGGVPDALDPTRPIAVICASGQRAAGAASLLQRHGAREVVHVADGGVPRWEREGWPVEAPGRAR